MRPSQDRSRIEVDGLLQLEIVDNEGKVNIFEQTHSISRLGLGGFDPLVEQGFGLAGIDGFLVPVGILVCAAILLYNIIKAAATYMKNRGDDITSNVTAILICAIIIAILATKSLWWSFITGGGV